MVIKDTMYQVLLNLPEDTIPLYIYLSPIYIYIDILYYPDEGI